MSTNNTHFGFEKIKKIMDGKKTLYFIGIGGISMCSLAHISHLRGYHVSGYDRTRSPLTDKLEEMGIKINYVSNTDSLKNCDVVIYTVAIPADNPEYMYAQTHNIPCISRADYLGFIMSAYKNRVGVSGMHGKSTTTAITSKIFLDADVDPTIFSGARLRELGSEHRIGGEEYFIFEACEYKDSFLDFNPTIAVVLNIEMDHVDYFSSIEQIEDSFSEYMNRTSAGGCVVINSDDPLVLRAAKLYKGRIVTFAVENEKADYRAVNISFNKGRAEFDILLHGKYLCRAEMSVPGEHIVCDALASAAAASECGISPEAIESGLKNFVGTERRMEFRGKITETGTDVYEDYAHHPTEIRTTLRGAKQMGYNRIICVFQPHTYSRTAELFHDFTESLKVADIVILADIYAAREPNIYGVSSEMLAKQIEDSKYFESFPKIANHVKSTAKQDDMVMIMGAGDVNKISDLLIC